MCLCHHQVRVQSSPTPAVAEAPCNPEEGKFVVLVLCFSAVCHMALIVICCRFSTSPSSSSSSSSSSSQSLSPPRARLFPGLDTFTRFGYFYRVVLLLPRWLDTFTHSARYFYRNARQHRNLTATRHPAESILIGECAPNFLETRFAFFT
jgi:hypothetical protein